MTVQDCVKEFEFYTVDELVYLEKRCAEIRQEKERERKLRIANQFSEAFTDVQMANIEIKLTVDGQVINLTDYGVVDFEFCYE